MTVSSRPLRFEDASEPATMPDGYWWVCRAIDTGVLIAIRNPRLEPDGDEDGIWYAPEYDELMIEGYGWRPVTDAESDEYGDDIYTWLRACDWRN